MSSKSVDPPEKPTDDLAEYSAVDADMGPHDGPAAWSASDRPVPADVVEAESPSEGALDEATDELPGSDEELYGYEPDLPEAQKQAGDTNEEGLEDPRR